MPATLRTTARKICAIITVRLLQLLLRLGEQRRRFLFGVEAIQVAKRQRTEKMLTIRHLSFLLVLPLAYQSFKVIP